VKLPDNQVIYQVDAFADKPFTGNPAAVCPLDAWISDDLMQTVAAENNLSETAFFVKSGSQYDLRWFTPVHEVDLCGHATLASAYVLFNLMGFNGDKVVFNTRSGLLTVVKRDEWYEMDFPCQPAEPCETPSAITSLFGDSLVECLTSADYLVVLDSEAEVVKAAPDMSVLKQLDLRGLMITAPGNSYDFVSRFFAPKYGIDEDPVTGSSFTRLIPYWAGKLDKQKMLAKQVSKRGGEVRCALNGDRVAIAGQAVLYMTGKLGSENNCF
jgi:PhzF family phenazine biosynthesis protein